MPKPGVLTFLAVGGVHAGLTPESLESIISDHYPAHYVVHKLEPSQSIGIDGRLDEPAWAEVPWLDSFLDLAGPRYQGRGNTTWQEASREYAKRFTGEENPTRVKMRWDDEYLYVGAQLHSRHPAATVSGHCEHLQSEVWSGTPVLPYFDDDFEVFIDASQDNYFYVEYEMNARNATYETLWSLPQSGLGSVAPECGGGDSPRRVCCNTTWNRGKGLCDKPPVEAEAGSWTMEMYDAGKRPGTGMQSSATNTTDSWTIEIRFPILSTGEHGGLINLEAGSYYPGTDPERLHPRHGQKYWWATFANAIHAPWWADLNATSVRKPQLIKSLCQETIADDEKRNGFSQFLVDANNAAPTCYYEAASQHLGGHQYMHNPDNFGYLQFDTHGPQHPNACRNVQWLGRFVLAQLYQAQVQYLTNVKLGNGAYTSSLAQLLSPSVCVIENACNATALSLLANRVSVRVSAQEGRVGPCARYAVGDEQTSNWTGGPCFNATVGYTVQSQANPSLSRQAAQADLQALIIPFAGLPASTRKLLLDGGWDRRGLNVHNIHHNAPMTAELAVALALAAAKQLLPADRMLRRGDWSARGIPADGDPDPMPQMLLEGSTALVLGHGAVGKRISRVMSALGMTVLATRQSAPPGSLREEDSVYIHASADMHALLPKANVLFVCVPEGASTVGLVGQKEIGLLPGGAVIVNCARGSVLDEDALFDGLQSGHLLGAGIDVWYKYPVDSITRTCTPVSAKHDFGSLQNIIMSPHRAGAVGCTHTETFRIRELARLCNAAFEGGVDSMPNRVCVGRGY